MITEEELRPVLSLHQECQTSLKHLLEAGVNLRLIQEWLGHNSPGTTSVYTHLTVKAEQRVAVESQRI